MASLALSLLASPNAHAGTYTWATTDANGNITAQSPSFSGGIVNVVTLVHTPRGSDIQPPRPFSTSNGHYTGSGGCEVNSTISSSKPGSVKVNSPASPIVATFTWQPASGQTSTTDPPPPAVIVQQNCTASASWSTWQTGTGTGSADCALPGAFISYSADSSGAVTGMTSSGTLYTVLSSPSASFSIPAQSAGAYQPTASVSAIAGSSGDTSATARIDYQVQAFPVTLNLGGTIKDSSGNYNILIGQHCTASLSGIPAALLNNVANPPTYQWSVSGTTFQTWSADTPPFPVIVGGIQIGITPENPDATYEVDGPGPLTNPTAGWYWNDIAKGTGNSAQETVSCTATVTPPMGQGSAFTVSATQPVTVWTPVWTATGEGASAVVNNTYAGGSGFWLHAGPGPLDSGVTNGMTWTTTLSPPPAPIPFGSGSLALAQIITGSDSGYTTNTTPSISLSGSLNGQTGLDNIWPYGWDTATPNAGSIKYESGDSPGINVDGDKSAHDNMSFEDYLMYSPPGSVQYVPVAKYIWSANMGASLPATGNWINSTGSAGTVTDAQRTGNFLPSNEFPSWTQIVQ